MNIKRFKRMVMDESTKEVERLNMDKVHFYQIPIDHVYTLENYRMYFKGMMTFIRRERKHDVD